MEYFISNQKADGLKQVGSLYFSTNFTFGKNLVFLKEGYVFPLSAEVHENNFNQILNSDSKGIFNLIAYDIGNNVLNIKNDHLGQMLIYFYNRNNVFYLSNNFWSIFKAIGAGVNTLNSNYIKSRLFFGVSPISDQTIAKDINIIKSASEFKYFPNKGNVETTNYWSFNSKADYSISFDDAAEQFNANLHGLFNQLKQRFGDRPVGFGNSGGLDSRLIALYGSDHGLNLKGITIQDRIPGIFPTGTHSNSNKIAKYFGFKNSDIYYYKGDFANQLLLDIRNSPMGSCQMLKNPYQLWPETDALITGQHGYMVGRDVWNETLNNYNDTKLIKYYFLYIARHKFFPSKYRTRITRLQKLLFGADYTEMTLKQLIDTPLSNLFTPEEKNLYLSYITDYIDSTKDDFYLDRIRNFHQKTMGMHVFGGGFESLSRTKETYFTYYPSTFFDSESWPQEFFFNKKMLRYTIKKQSPFLTKIPNQNFKPIFPQGHYDNVAPKIKLLLRGNGLMYGLWIKNKQYQKLFSEIFSRPNPYFDYLFDKDEIKNLQLETITPHGSLDFLKTKAILDILHYNELKKLDTLDFLIR